jgi:hypothetical protein
MKVATILDHIDSGHISLPVFQRGYVWNRDQVRGLFDSLYHRHPIGELLVWATESSTAEHRGEGILAPGVVKLLLDGQQRITTLYGVVRGKPPKFFEGNAATFTGLMFNLESEVFEFYQAVKMQDDHLWIDVSKLMQKGTIGLGDYVAKLQMNQNLVGKLGIYIGRLSRLLGCTDIDLYVEEVTGSDKTIDVVVEIFNRVNSGGTKLSKGDLALAKICSEWPEARDEMKKRLSYWSRADFQFSLDWLLRSVNAFVTGEAKFLHLHDQNSDQIKQGLASTAKHIDTCLNFIGGRLGIDHDRVFFAKFAIPVMVRYLAKSNGSLGEKERDKLLFWFVQSGMWGRFSGSTESYLDKDLAAIEAVEPLDKLLEEFRSWHGSLRVNPEHFGGWSLGARFYPVLYMITRMGGSRDWGNGLALKASLLGKMSRLEVHHIFPKALLYQHKYGRSDANAIANFCFLTKDTNLSISDQAPDVYFTEIEKMHPGALASQWIPMDRKLWKVEYYRQFLHARRELLAEDMNKVLGELLHGDTKWLEESSMAAPSVSHIMGGVSSHAEEEELDDLNNWMTEHGLPEGELAYDFSDEITGEQRATFDLAWPKGIQVELSQPVAVLLNENAEILSLANAGGFRCFTDSKGFKEYVQKEILGLLPV